MNNERIEIYDLDFSEIFDRIPYYMDLKKTHKANYLVIKSLKKIQVKKKLSFKRNADGSPELYEGRLRIVSNDPISFKQWEKIILNLKEYLRRHYLPEDMFII